MSIEKLKELTQSEKSEVESYFNGMGFDRWNRIYSDSDDVNKVQRNIRILLTSSLSLNVRVHKTRGGKRGKTVTVISGLELDALAAKLLLKSLKSICGVGGTVKGETLELQGDQVKVVLELLRKEGYCPKQSGG